MRPVPRSRGEPASLRVWGQTSSRTWRSTWLSLLLFGTGCSASPKNPPSRASSSTSASVQAAGNAPLPWRYHPSQAMGVLAERPLTSQGRLLVGRGGERWLAPASREAHAAGTLAPESLVGLFQSTSVDWVFVGESGSTYRSSSPLGPLSEGVAPPKPLARVVVNDRQILAIGPALRLWQSDNAGERWHTVGPKGARFADIWASRDSVLALQTPESLWWSEDGAKHFARLPISPFGVTRLRSDRFQRPVAVSILGNKSFSVGSPPSLASAAIQWPDENLLPPRTAKGPNATSIRQGSAQLNDTQYLELRSKPTARLLVGNWSEPLRSLPAPTLSACQKGRISGQGNWVHVICSTQQKASTSLRAFVSGNGGETFRPLKLQLVGRLREIRMATSATGDLLVTGICPPAHSASGCARSGIYLVSPELRDAGSADPLQEVAAPALVGPALALAYVHDGADAIAIGRRTKNDSLYSFFMGASDLSFAPHKLDVTHARYDRVESIQEGNYESIAVVLSSSSHSIILNLDRSGVPSSQHSGPRGGTALGAAGYRAFALSNDRAWQSDDAGANWHRVPLPSAGRCRAPSCPPAVQCSRQGCVIAAQASRIGWTTPSTTSPQALLKPHGRRSSRSPIAANAAFSCLPGSISWTELTGVRRIPRAAQASLGTVSAFALAYDFSNASSGTWTFPQTGLHPPSYIPLLAPRSSPNDYAMAPSLQVEGVASLRYPIVSSEISGPERGTPIDVSWSNFLTGQTVRRQLLVSGSFLPGDYDSPLSGARRARPALLSIAGRGLYVRPHARARQSEPTYFATAQSDSLLPPIPWPVRPAESRFEIARSANRALPLLFVEGGATVLRARQAPNHQWQFDAMNVGSPRFRLNSPTDTWDIAYRGTDVGLQRTTAYANGEVLGTWFPFGLNQNVFEAPQTTPTQQSLPHEPRPCTQSDLATTPRVLAPGVRSTRHKVTIVDSPGRENPLWTETAVLYGSSARPCFAAFDASTQNHRAKKTVRALIHSNGIGWLFRTSPKSTRRDVRIEYRAMQCRLGTAASGP